MSVKMKIKQTTILLSGIFLLGISSCQKEASNSDRAVQEIQTEGKISSIIRSPITADGTVDTVNVAKMDFQEFIYDFGEVTEGDIVEHTFKFENTGKVPLIISDAHSTCGCTVPDWPRSPIAPGDGGEIKVTFNTLNKPEIQEKPVIITANTYPSVVRVYLKGYVNKKS